MVTVMKATGWMSFWRVFPKVSASLSDYTPWKRTNFPWKINGWFRCISYWNGPFFGGHVHFQGCSCVENRKLHTMIIKEQLTGQEFFQNLIPWVASVFPDVVVPSFGETSPGFMVARTWEKAAVPISTQRVARSSSVSGPTTCQRWETGLAKQQVGVVPTGKISARLESTPRRTRIPSKPRLGNSECQVDHRKVAFLEGLWCLWMNFDLVSLQLHDHWIRLH